MAYDTFQVLMMGACLGVNVHYFAYGSCMDEADFRRTVPKFQILGGAVLEDYKLVFSKFGESRKGGVADIIPAKGNEVQGVLYVFDQALLPKLDEREGVPVGMYERIEMDVCFAGYRQKVYTYQVLDKEAKEVKPSAEYVRLIWNGMNQYATTTYRERFRKRLFIDFEMRI